MKHFDFDELVRSNVALAQGFLKDYSKGEMARLFLQLCELIDFDQMILYAHRGFIHVSYVNPESNRGEAIIKP